MVLGLDGLRLTSVIVGAVLLVVIDSVNTLPRLPTSSLAVTVQLTVSPPRNTSPVSVAPLPTTTPLTFHFKVEASALPSASL